MKPGEFEAYLKEQFGLTLPENVQLSRDKGSAIRIYSRSLNSIQIRGSRGFVAYSKKTGLSSDFIQIFGKLATKNIVKLDKEDAYAFVYGEEIRKKIHMKKGTLIVKYKDYVLGVGTFDGRILHSKIRGKKRRNIENEI